MERSLSVVTILKLEKHSGMINELREVGVRIKLIENGDVAGAEA